MAAIDEMTNNRQLQFSSRDTQIVDEVLRATEPNRRLIEFKKRMQKRWTTVVQIRRG